MANLYEATQGCYVLGVQLSAGQKIGLSEENEKELRLGKFAEERVDKLTGKKTLSTFMHLKRIKGQADEDQAMGVADGMVVYPPKKPFALVGPA